MGTESTRFFSLVPMPISALTVEIALRKNSYAQFKKEFVAKEKSIATVYNDIMKDMKDCGDHYEIEFTSSRLHKDDFDIPTEIFLALFKDISTISLNEVKETSMVQGTIPKNAFHLFSAKFQPIQESVRPAVNDYLLGLYEKSEGTDLSFCVEGKEIKAHRVILGQREMLLDKTLDLSGWNFDLVDVYVRHLYGDELNLKDKDLGFCIGLFDLNNFLGKGTGDIKVKDIIRNAIREKVNASNITSLFSVTDPELKEFVNWKMYTIMNTGNLSFNKVEFKHLSQIYLSIMNCKFDDVNATLKSKLLEEIERKLEFDENFIKLCEVADENLKSKIENGVKANGNALLNELKNGKNGKLKDHYRAYSDMITGL